MIKLQTYKWYID